MRTLFFDNPLNLSNDIIELRLRKIDQRIQAHTIIVDGEDDLEHNILSMQHVPADSTITNQDILTILATPATPEELAKIQNKIDARDKVRNIPNWATWSETQALDWWITNLSDTKVDAISNLTEAKELLKKQNQAIQALARLVIALRDKTWPDL